MTRKGTLSAYTAAHFCVDFACFVMLFGLFVPAQPDVRTATVGILLYNILAFGLQPFVGVLSDRYWRLPIGIIGCALTAVGLCLSFAPWAALVLCALGNALFHVGGGKDSLHDAGGRMARSGVYVSSGALGVSLGMLYGKGSLSPLLPICLLLASCIAIYMAEKRDGARQPHTWTGASIEAGGSIPFTALILLCLAAVMLRSLVGSTMPVTWKTTVMLGLLPGAGSALGKCLGGFAADRFGARRAGVVSLLLSAPLMLIPHPVPCVAGIILFNMAMPITLCSAASLFPRHPGFAFGLTTLALLAGNVPSFFFIWPDAAAPWAIAALTLCAAACVYFSTGKNQETAHSPALTRGA